MKKIILSLYPNTRGLGYVCLQHPNILIDYAVVTVSPISNDVLMERYEKLVKTFKPTTIILRDGGTKNQRLKELSKRIRHHAASNKIPVYSYARHEITNFFEMFGAANKDEIVTKIITEFPELEYRRPRKRKSWAPEDYNMGIFDALALVATHRYLTE